MKKIALLTLMLLIAGCTLVSRRSSVTPPQNVPTAPTRPQDDGAAVNGGAQKDGEESTIVFRNQRHNYSLKIPKGWGMAEDDPVQGRPELPIKDSNVEEITFSQPEKNLNGNMVAIFAYYNIPKPYPLNPVYCNPRAATDRVDIKSTMFDRETGLTTAGKSGRDPQYPFECLMATVHGVQYFLYREGDSPEGRSLMYSFDLIDGSGLWNEFRDARNGIISFQYPKTWRTSTDLDSEVVIALADPAARPETWPNFIVEYDPNIKKLTLEDWYRQSFWEIGRIGVDEELTVTGTRGYKLATSTDANPRYIFVGPSTGTAPHGEYLIKITTDTIDKEILEYILSTLVIRRR